MARPTISTTFNAVDRMSPTLRGMQGRVTGFSRSAQRSLGSVGRSFSGMTRIVRAAGAAIITGFVGRGIGALISAASSIEDATAAFTPLMGGAERAAELVQRLNETAASTPFQFENISDAAKQLLPVMNGDIERTIDTFRMLGDTAGGNAQKLDSITRGYTKALLQNRVTLESLNMIAEAGVPIFDQLSTELGVTTAEMFDMVSAGEVTTDNLTNTFQRMTTEGGIFFDGMSIASQTFSGRMSTLKDNITLTAATLGQTLLPLAKDFVDRAIEIAANVREWVTANQDLIRQRIQDTIDGIRRVVERVVDLWNSGLIPAILAGVVAFKTITAVVAGAQGIMAAVKGLQLLMATAGPGIGAAFTAMLGPVGIVAAAIAGLVGLVVLLINKWDEWRAKILESDMGNAVFGRGEEILQNEGNFNRSNAETYGISSNSGIGAMAEAYRERIVQESTTTNETNVTIDLQNVPIGVNPRMRGAAPNVRMNYGMSGGR